VPSKDSDYHDIMCNKNYCWDYAGTDTTLWGGKGLYMHGLY